jgi:hypothetical protein
LLSTVRCCCWLNSLVVICAMHVTSPCLNGVACLTYILLHSHRIQYMSRAVRPRSSFNGSKVEIFFHVQFWCWTSPKTCWSYRWWFAYRTLLLPCSALPTVKVTSDYVPRPSRRLLFWSCSAQKPSWYETFLYLDFPGQIMYKIYIHIYQILLIATSQINGNEYKTLTNQVPENRYILIKACMQSECQV